MSRSFQTPLSPSALRLIDRPKQFSAFPANASAVPFLDHRNQSNASTPLVCYFAIGSMCNPVSLHLRSIFPLCSIAARAPGFSLTFQTENGMANFRPTKQFNPTIENKTADCSALSSSLWDGFYGVVHLVTPADLDRLDKIETGYQRVQIKVIDANEIERMAIAYQMSKKIPGNLQQVHVKIHRSIIGLLDAFL
jgi:hypothetical protein